MRPDTGVTITLLTTNGRKRAMKQLALDADRSLASLYEEGAEYVARKYGVKLPPRDFHEQADQPRQPVEAAQ